MKRIDPVKSVKDWYHGWWLFSAELKQMQRDGAAVLLGIRKKDGLTQRQLADALGIDFTYLSKIENSATPMTVSFMKRLRKYIAEREGERILIE